ncbi:hypothetical protein COW83_03425 [Candidatus Collierbacteria bacterium CG22_combo_CG10-13_8_21_14_all_43_12]|uniref:Uncharacterized protein n=2 Tax=Candidatus Collieribacteriota TaxID=1752725 RepID=A0A2H0DVH5_9BACT|nr:hypothetical protein [bacterium]PIP85600.1 MAG: hypothetical protein COW83_03425 [Candidatus Collierbacteria bacterium CG22_combo_CG10-13_8_21_14_all_43_12]PJB48288.1 MAG: hypothetical protein CO104_01625 [Candidatus Collierbacteria bacterium CG_4_9_14_3_um_filter_43_16]
MLDPNFDVVLYRDSPFVPPATVQSAFVIAKMVTHEGFHPAIAIATKLRDIFGEHLQFLDAQTGWLVEKFSVNQQDLDDYYFGLLLPVTLMTAALMARYNPMKNILDHYFPLSEDPFFVELRRYGSQNIPAVDNLLHLESPNPMDTAEPVYRHCRFEVFSFTPWYQVGIEAGKRSYHQFARLY